MSITGLVCGVLITDPERKPGRTDKTFVRARISAETPEAEVIVSATAWGSAADRLEALRKGDDVAITGRIKVSRWTDREGQPHAELAIEARLLLTAYELKRKRQVLNGEKPTDPSSETGDAS